MRFLLPVAFALCLSSCGTAAHWLGTATSLVSTAISPVTNILRNAEGGTEKQWEQSARRGYRPASSPTSRPASSKPLLPPAPSSTHDRR